MPSHKHHNHGDLYVNISVRFPEHIDPAVIPLLEKSLPPRDPLPKFPKTILLDEVVLAEPDVRRRPDRGGDDSMDEDGEGEPRVQCANQ